MSRPLALWVHGVGAWAPGLPDWTALRAHLDGAPPREDAPSRPAATALAPAERRRAPDSVRLAVDVAAQAVAASGIDAADLPSVFASAHGDAGIMDYMCATLADTPTQMSPTRFHNSVHNAAAGYWTIATGCRRASNAVCADRTSFGAGLLEAATQAVVGHEAVLLAAFDAPGSGPLAEMIHTRTPFACALVLSPEPGPRALAHLALHLEPATTPDIAPRDPALARLATTNACGDSLVLLEALHHAGSGTVRIASGSGLQLRIDTEARS